MSRHRRAPAHRRAPNRRLRGGPALVAVMGIANAVSLIGSGSSAAEHAPSPARLHAKLVQTTSTRKGMTPVPQAKASSPTPTTVEPRTGAPAPLTSISVPPTLDSTIASIAAAIPGQWKAPGWSYSIVPATNNGAFGDTWSPSPPVSQYSRSQLTPFLGSAGGYQVIKMVVLHEAENAKAYSVVDANDWSTVPGWPATFASEVSLNPGYTDVDAAANCLELGALGFRLDPSSGYAEPDLIGGCSDSLAAWLTQQVAAAAAAGIQSHPASADSLAAAPTAAQAPSQVATSASSSTPPTTTSAIPLSTSAIARGPGLASFEAVDTAPSILTVVDQTTGAPLFSEMVPSGGGTYSLPLTNSDSDLVTLTYRSGGGSLSCSGVSCTST